MTVTASVTDVAASPVKSMEPAPSPSKTIACSPTQLQSSPMKVATPLRSPRVATPLRGRKRTASLASLSQRDVPEKVLLLDRFQDHDETTADAAGNCLSVSNVSFDSLESYKSQTDSATIVPEPSAANCDEKHGDATAHEVETMSCSMEELVDTAPLEVTVEWQDAETGTMMGFL